MYKLMALAKERSIPHEPFMSIIMSPTSPTGRLSPQIPTISSEEKAIVNGAPFRGANNQPAHQAQDAQSVINFSTSFLASNDQSLLSFEQKDQEYYVNSDHQWWNNHIHNHNHNHNHNHINPRFSSDFNCYQTASASDYRGCKSSKPGNNHRQYSGEDGSYSCGWLYSESTVTADSLEESDAQESAGFNKRPHVQGESTKAVKKQRTNNNATNKKPKVQNSSPSKDPQSIAAKNRRERISERLKILQELVPNGSKVDLVTMLEKAISYVKFLQLQVKVLATDEFWPVQGGKAPDISQVREAIDAILSSQRQKSTSTSQ